MKTKQIFFALVLLLGLISYQSCEKLIPEPFDPSSMSSPAVIRNPLPWTVTGGTLAFIDTDHLHQALIYLHELDFEDRLHLEDSLGIRTLKSISLLIDEAEGLNQDQFFAGVPDTLTNAQYLAMNYQPSSLFQTYEQAGVVQTIFEPDSSWYQSMRVREASMWDVLNEDGEVIVGDLKYVYRDSIQETYSLSDGQLLSSIITGKQASVLTNYNRHWHVGGSQASSDKWAWLYCENDDKKRYAGKVRYSSHLHAKGVRVALEVTAKAQRKKNGIWRQRSDFKPITEVSGSWDYRYTREGSGKAYTFKGSEHHMSNMGYAKAPVYGWFAGKNDYSRYLHPSGHHAHEAYPFTDNVELLNPSFAFTFEGCSSKKIYVVP